LGIFFPKISQERKETLKIFPINFGLGFGKVLGIIPLEGTYYYWLSILYYFSKGWFPRKAFY